MFFRAAQRALNTGRQNKYITQSSAGSEMKSRSEERECDVLPSQSYRTIEGSDRVVWSSGGLKISKGSSEKVSPSNEIYTRIEPSTPK